MRIIVLGESHAALRHWATHSLVGREIERHQQNMTVRSDGVEFVMLTYDETQFAAGLTCHTVLHVDRIPLHLATCIRVRK